VAYGLAGKVDIDLETEPIGTNDDGEEIFLGTSGPIRKKLETIHDSVSAGCSKTSTRAPSRATSAGRHSTRPRARSTTGTTNRPTSASRRSFQDFPLEEPGVEDIADARCLLTLGDTVTTDHISPPGPFSEDLPAGQWLKERGVEPYEFNTYGSAAGTTRS